MSDIYKMSNNYLLESVFLHRWADAANMLEMMAKKKQAHWRLPIISGLAVGGSEEMAIPVMAAVTALHTSIIMIDDLLDGDKRFEALGYTAGEVANLGAAFQAAGFDAIARSSARVEVQYTIMNNLNEMLFLTAYGQNEDFHLKMTDEASYWHIAQAKSSPFFGSALFSGAIISGATMEIARSLQEIGWVYGEMVQVHDDLRDALETPAAEDWQEGSFSLPILFAAGVNHPEQAVFIEAQRNIDDPKALRTAQRILFSSGAVSYCIYQVEQRYKTIQTKLQTIKLSNPAPMVSLVEEIFLPMKNLLELAAA